MSLISKVTASLKWKKNDAYCSSKLGISLEKYREIKSLIKWQSDPTNQITTKQKEGVTEFKEDLENGTAFIKGIALTEPRSPEEIIKVLKLDTNKWKLGVYWNKEQPSTGLWVVSAQVSLKKDNEISIEDMEEILQKIFQDKTFTPVRNYPTISNKKALFVYLSDRHIAAFVNDTAMYSNEYSSTIYGKRLKEVLHEIIYQANTYGRFEDIYIIDLGDKMDGLNGQTTRGGHKLPQNMSNKQAFEAAISNEIDFFDTLFNMDLAINYHVYQNANSNHGGDYDYMVNRAIEIYINAKYPDVDTRIMQKFIEHIEYGNHVILLTHGKDDEDMKHGLPLHLNDKVENYFRKYLMHHGINISDSTISIIKGDLHMAASQHAYGFRYRNVLSLFGGSKWIGTNFGPNKAGCSFEIIEQYTDRIIESNLLF